MTIGEQLGIFLVKNNITQSELAKKLGVATSTAGSWIRGVSNISNKYLNKLNDMGFHFSENTDFTCNERIENENIAIGNFVKEMRIANNMYQSELADLINLSQNRISDIEKGKLNIREEKNINIKNSLEILFPNLNDKIAEIERNSLSKEKPFISVPLPYSLRKRDNNVKNILMKDIDEYIFKHKSSIKNLSNKLHIHHSSFSVWKCGKNQPSFNNLRKLFNNKIISLSTFNEIKKRIQFGKLIRNIRRSKNMTQKEFSSYIKIDEEIYISIEKGIIDFIPYKETFLKELNISINLDEDTIEPVEENVENCNIEPVEENVESCNIEPVEEKVINSCKPIDKDKEFIHNQAVNSIYLSLFKSLYKEITDINKDEIQKIKILKEKIKITNSLNGNNTLLLLLEDKLK